MGITNAEAAARIALFDRQEGEKFGHKEGVRWEFGKIKKGRAKATGTTTGDWVGYFYSVFFPLFSPRGVTPDSLTSRSPRYALSPGTALTVPPCINFLLRDGGVFQWWVLLWGARVG